MDRYDIDGNKIILSKFEVEKLVDVFLFTPYDAYAVDIVMSTGDGSTREGVEKPSIYRRDKDVVYKLKLRSSKTTLNEINEKFSTFPFNLRQFDDMNISKAGLFELTNQEMVKSYPVIRESEGEYVAQIKFTVLVLPNSTIRITQAPIKPTVKSKYSIDSDPDLQQILQLSTKRKKKKKKKDVI